MTYKPCCLQCCYSIHNCCALFFFPFLSFFLRSFFDLSLFLFFLYRVYLRTKTPELPLSLSSPPLPPSLKNHILYLSLFPFPKFFSPPQSPNPLPFYIFWFFHHHGVWSILGFNPQGASHSSITSTHTHTQKIKPWRKQFIICNTGIIDIIDHALDSSNSTVSHISQDKT